MLDSSPHVASERRCQAPFLTFLGSDTKCSKERCAGWAVPERPGALSRHGGRGATWLALPLLSPGKDACGHVAVWLPSPS